MEDTEHNIESPEYQALLTAITADMQRSQDHIKKTKNELHEHIEHLKQALRLQNQIIDTLESERQLLKAAIQNIPAGVIIADSDTEKPLFSNPQVTKVWRKPYEKDTSVLNHPSHHGFHPDGSVYQSNDWPLARSLKRQEVVNNEEIQFKRGDNSTGYMQVSSSPIHDEHNNMIAAVEIFTDITRRKEAENALSDSEQRYRELIETIPHGIEVIDTEGTIFFASSRLHEIYGCEDQSLIGSSIMDNIASNEEREQLQASLPELVRGQPTPETYIGKKTTADGRIIDLQIDWNYKRDLEGHVIGFISVITDITKRIEAEQLLRENEQMHRNVFETAWNGIVILSPHGHFMECNPAFLKLFGYTKKELSKIKVKQLLHPDSRPKLADFKEQLNQNAQVNVEIIAINKAGLSIPIEIVTGSSFSYHGFPALLTFIRDLTESKKVEKQLRQHQLQLAHASRMNTLGEMTAGIAHEINQPLGAIVNYTRGCIRRLQSKNCDYNTLIPAITEVSKQAQRAADIIQRLRRFARKGELKRSSVDINEVVRESISFLQPEISQHDIIIRKKLARNLPMTHADKIQLEQVVVNIIKNAIDAVSNSAQHENRIFIQTSHIGDRAIEILIHDFGPGLSVKSLENIFQPFFTTKDDGMGVGLAISQSIIEAHNGTITAMPAPKEGACFRITLPVQKD